MGKVVDQKVVEMRFDNGQFEKGVSQSVSSLDKLKSSLNGFNTGSFGSGISSLNGNFIQFNNTLNDGRSAFSILEEIGVGALRKIGETAVGVAGQIASNLWNSIKSGYNRYEEMMKSTQTIMYATRNEWEDQGEQMEYVNDQITKLQWYTDETSYNLSDMTSNVGKFIAAGIPLDNAVSNMMGIASWAAISGQNAEAASRAMYNLSQAMGQGALTMVDWRSIENANMATREFKQIAIETGIEFGKIWEGADGLLYTYDQNMKEVEINVDNFRTTLAGKWFDSDVLSATLDKYGAFAVRLNGYVDALGITTTEMIGYVDEALEKGLADVDVGDAEAMNAILDSIAKEAKIDAEDIELFSEALVQLTDDEYELGRAAFKAGQESKTLTDSIDYTKDALATAYNNIFQTIIGDYLESKEVWTQFSEMLYTWLVEPVEEFRDMLMEVKAYGGFDHLKNALLTIYDTITTIKQTVSDTIGGVLEKYHIGNKARSLLDILIKIDEFAQSISLQDWVWGSDIKNITIAAETLGRVIAKLSMDLDIIKRSASKAWETVFPKKDTTVGSFTDKLVAAADALEKWFDTFRMDPENADKITEIFENLLTVVKNFWDTITGIAGAIKDAWSQIFPPKTTDADSIIDKVHSFSETIANLSNSFKLTDEKADKLKRTFEGVFAVLDIFKQLFVAIVDQFKGGNGEVTDFTDAILTVTAAIGDWLVGVRDWLAENDTFHEVVGAIVDFIKNIPTYVDEASKALTGMDFGELMGEVWEWIKEIPSKVQDFFSIFSNNKETIDNAGETLETVSGTVSDISESVEKAKPTISQFFDIFKSNTETDGIGDFFKDLELKDWTDAIKAGGVLGVLVALAAVLFKFAGILDHFTKSGDKIVNSIKGMFDSFADVGKTLKKNIQANTFKTFATAILELAAAIFIIALLPMEKAVAAASMIGILMTILVAGFKLIVEASEKTDEKKLAQVKKLLNSLELVIATLIGGVFLLASQTDLGPMIAAGIVIGALIALVIGLIMALQEIDTPPKRLEQIKKVLDAVALVILSMGASLYIATMSADWKQLAAAGASMFAMMAIIFAFIEDLGKVSLTEKKVAYLSIVLEEVCKLLLAMGAALLIATIGGGSWQSLAAAGAAMSVMMIAMAAAFKIMPTKKTVADAAEAMAIASTAFIMMGVALMFATGGGADWKQLGMAGLVMAGMILAMALAFRIMPDSNSIIKAAAALAIASVGLLAIAMAISSLSGMTWEQVGIALAVLAGGLILVCAAGFAANYIGGGLIMLGIAMALIGQSALMAGAGMLLFANAMQILFSLDPEGVNGMLAAIDGFFQMFPSLMEQVARGLLAFGQAIVNGRQVLYEIFVGTFSTILDAYMEIMPKVVEAVVETLKQIIEAYRTIMPLVLAAIGETIIAILEMLTSMLPALFEFLTALFFELDAFIRTTAPQFIETVFFILTLLLDGLNTWLRDNLPKLRELINFVIQEACNSIRETSFIIGSTAVDTLIDALNIILERIGEITSIAVQIGIQVVLGVLDGFSEQIDDIIDAGAKFVISLIDGIADGIDKYAKEIKDAMDHLASSLKNAFCLFLGIDPNSTSSKSSTFSGFGENIMQGLIDGINSLLDKAKETITNVATSVSDWFKDVLQIESPSKVFASFGKYIDMGLAKGLTENADLVEDATGDVSDATIDGMSKVISKIGHMVENDIDADPTIRPVLDLTDITAGINTMDNMLSADRSVDLAGYGAGTVSAQITEQERLSSMLEDLKMSLGSDRDRDRPNQTMTFNIDGAKDPKAVADEISTILQNQIDRRNAVWV